jgi:hypothetical protein
MKSRIRHSSYVIDFLDVGFDSDSLSRILKSEIDQILQSFNTDSLEDWEITFNALYNSTDKIFIFKKTKSIPSEKEKEIVIHIPIPTMNIVSWGVKPAQLIKSTLYEDFKKYADALEVDYQRFSDRKDYILDCMRRAINFCFEDGFVVNGFKIKVLKPTG